MGKALRGSVYVQWLVVMMALIPIVLVLLEALIFGIDVNEVNWYRMGIGTTINVLVANWVYWRVRRIEHVLIDVVETKESFYTMVTHDLKSPLSTILMATEMANASKDCTAEIEMISRQTTGMLKMVDDLLCSQAGKAGKLNLKVGCVAVREALSPVLATVATTMHKHGINIISDVADVTCLCDKDRLSQILINLISNSIKNTPSGGFIAIHAQLSGDAVLFMIEDSGGGIAREKLASIFTSYETDGKFGGHGLGLSIVKSLVEAHHGRVWAESVIGEGTKIFFTIPKHIEGA